MATRAIFSVHEPWHIVLLPPWHYDSMHQRLRGSTSCFASIIVFLLQSEWSRTVCSAFSMVCSLSCIRLNRYMCSGALGSGNLLSGALSPITLSHSVTSCTRRLATLCWLSPPPSNCPASTRCTLLRTYWCSQSLPVRDDLGFAQDVPRFRHDASLRRARNAWQFAHPHSVHSVRAFSFGLLCLFSLIHTKVWCGIHKYSCCHKRISCVAGIRCW